MMQIPVIDHSTYIGIRFHVFHYILHTRLNKCRSGRADLVSPPGHRLTVNGTTFAASRAPDRVFTERMTAGCLPNHSANGK